VRFSFIAAEKAKDKATCIAHLCSALGVSRQGFYAWQARKDAPPTKRARETAELRSLVRDIHKQSWGTYGRPRIQLALRAIGRPVGANRIRRIMCQEGLCGRPRRRWRGSGEREKLPALDNLLARNFTASGPNRVWCGDVTEFRIGRRRLFLATVIDIFSRRVIGISFGPNANTPLVVRALVDAVCRRKPERDVVFHTDRASIYRSLLFRAVAQANGVIQSMSRAYNCLDNAVAESFFATLEHELASRRDWASVAQAERDIRDFVLNFYNPIRIHSTNNNLSPADFEALAA
jgi:transposase InsO family protein